MSVFATLFLSFAAIFRQPWYISISMLLSRPINLAIFELNSINCPCVVALPEPKFCDGLHELPGMLGLSESSMFCALSLKEIAHKRFQTYGS